MNRTFAPLQRVLQRQRGLALLVALLVLVAMSLAAIALIRSVDTSSMIAGNVAFRQGATLAADSGIEDARTFLKAQSSSVLEQDKITAGYYATSQDALDLTGNRTPTNADDNVKWPGATSGASSPKCLDADSAGNTVCYVIHRLCDSAGPVNVYTCSTRTGTSSTLPSSGGALQSEVTNTPPGPTIASSATSLVYYRITVRVAGPRNNVGFVQAFVII